MASPETRCFPIRPEKRSEGPRESVVFESLGVPQLRGTERLALSPHENALRPQWRLAGP